MKFAEKKFRLKVEDVLNKQFSMDFKGYSSVEVDEFLNSIIDDYQEYGAMIGNLGERLQEYKKQIATMEAKITELEGRQGAIQEESAAADGNMDILKCLTRLENAVFTSRE